MTEAEWLTSEDPRALELLVRAASERKARLFGCAVVRRLWSCLSEAVPDVVRVAEEYADGGASKGALRRARHAVRDKRLALETGSADGRTQWVAYWFAETVATIGAFGSVVAELEWGNSTPLSFAVPDWSVTWAHFREVSGNPFRPVSFSPSWRTDTVVALAARMYESRDFNAVPILADALQDAGCDSDDILNHCRDTGAAHVRGCWAVDLVLEKA